MCISKNQKHVQAFIFMVVERNVLIVSGLVEQYSSNYCVFGIYLSGSNEDNTLALDWWRHFKSFYIFIRDTSVKEQVDKCQFMTERRCGQHFLCSWSANYFVRTVRKFFACIKDAVKRTFYLLSFYWNNISLVFLRVYWPVCKDLLIIEAFCYQM